MHHYTKLSAPKINMGTYDTYWHFAVERHNIFLKKVYHIPGPWTTDPVLTQYKFTNVFRASDRVSQFLIDLQYTCVGGKEDIFFKTLLFKIFNKIETYQYLENCLENISYSTFSYDKYNELLTDRMAGGFPIYSAAYIMPSTKTFGFQWKHSNHLALLEALMKKNYYIKIQECNSMAEVYRILLSVPSFGSFLAFQYTIDLNYSSLINFQENDFVIAGPGAKSGILKCFSSMGDYSFEDVIKMMTDQQEIETSRLGLDKIILFGRPLQLIDCQNLFCEVDKYLRVSQPEVPGSTPRTRIKQKYKYDSRNIVSYFFPPKWDLNHLISQYAHNKNQR